MFRSGSNFSLEKTWLQFPIREEKKGSWFIGPLALNNIHVSEMPPLATRGYYIKYILMSIFCQN